MTLNYSLFTIYSVNNQNKLIMTTYKTLEEVQKDYPTLNIGNFTDFQKKYLLKHEVKTIDEDYNINCIDCIDCEDCTDCISCKYCIGCADCRYCEDCMGCEDCLNCADCIDCSDCENCKDYTNNKPNQN